MKKCAALLLTLVACGGDSSRPEATVCDHHAGGGLADFDVPCDPGPGGVLVTASGEAFAKNGYAFPPASPDDVVFVDGWSITYDRVLTTVDHITLSTGPDTVPTDQSQCANATGKAILCGSGSDVVAEIDGPFALDLKAGGALPDADGADMDATPIGALTGRNKESNDAFDPTAKYAFGFETVAATTSARNVNLDAAAVTDYMEMAQKHYSTMLVGTATWLGNHQGDLTTSGCTQTTAYDFSVLPKVIKFRIGLPAPTTYRNAQNPALMGDAEPNEEHPRGVVTLANASTIAQVTLHLDHAFWESFVHDSPAHFDQFAAKVAGKPSPASITLEDYKGFALRPFVDVQGNAVPWRSCLPAADYTAPSAGAMGFDTLSVNVDPTAACTQGSCTSIRDFFDYTLYNHSTFGHLNADGLSFVDRQYPSPK